MFEPTKLKNLRLKKGVSQVEIANVLNVTRAAYSCWEKGAFKPNSKNLQQLADYFNVDLFYFESEYEIVEKYLKLNSLNQHKLLSMADKLYTSQLFTYKVHAKLSAGTGIFYDDEYSFDTVYFDREINYDIASWISGDSMMPKYQNGDVALIKQSGYDYDGMVYAVVYNEETYIKKVFVEGNTLRLVSINDNYDDIIAPIEEARIIGPVVNSFTPIEESTL